jgi:hypothetical protein
MLTWDKYQRGMAPTRLATVPPSSSSRWPVVVLSGGSSIEVMGKMVSSIFGGAQQPEGGARDAAEWCGDDAV